MSFRVRQHARRAFDERDNESEQSYGRALGAALARGADLTGATLAALDLGRELGLDALGVATDAAAVRDALASRQLPPVAATSRQGTDTETTPDQHE